MKTDVIREVEYKGHALVHRSNTGLNEPGERLAHKTEWHVYRPGERWETAVDIVYSMKAAKVAVDMLIQEEGAA